MRSRRRRLTRCCSCRRRHRRGSIAKGDTFQPRDVTIKYFELLRCRHCNVSQVAPALRGSFSRLLHRASRRLSFLGRLGETGGDLQPTDKTFQLPLQAPLNTELPRLHWRGRSSRRCRRRRTGRRCRRRRCVNEYVCALLPPRRRVRRLRWRTGRRCRRRRCMNEYVRARRSPRRRVRRLRCGIPLSFEEGVLGSVHATSVCHNATGAATCSPLGRRRRLGSGGGVGGWGGALIHALDSIFHALPA